VSAGGLMSYSPNLIKRSIGSLPIYVDRILKGDKPADLPVQASADYQLVINTKTRPGPGSQRFADAQRPCQRVDPG